MRTFAQIKAAHAREQERKNRARMRRHRRNQQRREGKQQRREEKRLRTQQKKQRAADARPSIRAGEENLFNGVSAVIHTLTQRALSNMRLSLGLRISWNYVGKVLRLMLWELLICVLLFAVREGIHMARDVKSLPEETVEVFAIEDLSDSTDSHEALARRDSLGMTVDVFAARNGQINEKLARWTGNLVALDVQGPTQVQVTYLTDLPAENGRYLARYDIAAHMRMLYVLLGIIAAVNLVSVLSFILSGRALNGKVLAPIGRITETAQMLSENDLGRRINIEGTNNELRDLALVINDMLDRIELAYNAQKQFVSDASHELRTPIAVIQGYAGLLERWGKDSPEVRDEAIGAIVSESGAMKELVEKLLFLARHDKQTLKMRVERFDVREVVEETLRETQMLVTDRRIEAGEVQSAVIDADRASIKQALRIFVDNAVKYTPAGGTVTVECVRRDAMVHVSVRDTGVGIAQSELSAIFERFYRADTARSAETPGHGLGLSIAKIIVLSHKGRISVKSRVGKGSTFTMILQRV